MTRYLVLAFTLLSGTCLAEPEQESAKVLAEAFGDLDKDGKEEKVIVIDNGLPTDMGTARSILIYKQMPQGWKLWHTNDSAVLPSLHGGMMGDPFTGIDVERGALVIRHFGGSNQKWSYVHRFRYSNKLNDWQLIGATVEYGLIECDYTRFDVNVSTGKAIYQTINNACYEGEQKSKETHDLNVHFNSTMLMDNFYPGENELLLPTINQTIYY
ncbi:hypothetical protein ACQEXU_04065 [Vibrio sp. TRT 21S02]|uniref:hypothetical protein n=1 Tax=Vibrio sp. TRT 21S02 TaxID=3418507 RepID=UPI003CF2F1E1